MSQYIDGFVLSIPKNKIDAYREIAIEAAGIWEEYGALEYRECIGDDLDVEHMVPFPVMAGTKPDETVIFTYVVFASREARDEANAKIMADPRMEALCETTNGIFDYKRMAYGGFQTLVYQ